MSLKNTLYTYTLDTHCNTEPVLKTYHYTWIIKDFWLIHDFTHTINAAQTGLPFSLQMIKKPTKNKVLFIVESVIKVDQFKCYIYLEPSEEYKGTLEKLKLNCQRNDTKWYHELDINYLWSQKNMYTQDGALKLHCKFHHLQHIVHKMIQTNVIKERGELTSRIMCKSSHPDTDAVVIFQVEQRAFSVRKHLFYTKSGYFRTLDVCQTQSNVTIVEDHPFNVMEKFICFIEYDILPNIETAKLDILLGLFSLAERYDIPDLLIICEQYLKKFVLYSICYKNKPKVNVIEILLFATKRNTKDLLKFTANCIALHFKQIVGRESFPHVISTCHELYTQLKQTALMVENATYTSEV